MSGGIVGQTIVFRGLPPSGSDGRRRKPIVCPTKTPSVPSFSERERDSEQIWQEHLVAAVG
jgi:hypothetical protein